MMVETLSDIIADLNQILKKCWLQSAVEIHSWNPPRDDEGRPQGADPKTCPPMNRFAFRHDCSTSLDGEISADETGFRVIYNGHAGRYPEDQPFRSDLFKSGNFVTWEQMETACKEFVYLANKRVGF